MLLDVAATAAGALPSAVSPCRDCLTFVVVVVVVVSWKRSRSGLCVWVRGLGAKECGSAPSVDGRFA